MKQNHAHKLKRFVYSNGTKIYFCTLPDCTFRIGIGLALGKRTVCWRCGKEFNMTTYTLSLAKPHCEECHRFKVEPDKKPVTVKTQPVSVVSGSMGTDVVSSMKERLGSIVYKQLEDKEEDL